MPIKRISCNNNNNNNNIYLEPENLDNRFIGRKVNRLRNSRRCCLFLHTYNNNNNIFFFQEDNIFGKRASLTYGPHLQIYV